MKSDKRSLYTLLKACTPHEIQKGVKKGAKTRSRGRGWEVERRRTWQTPVTVVRLDTVRVPNVWRPDRLGRRWTRWPAVLAASFNKSKPTNHACLFSVVPHHFGRKIHVSCTCKLHAVLLYSVFYTSKTVLCTYIKRAKGVDGCSVELWFGQTAGSSPAVALHGIQYYNTVQYSTVQHRIVIGVDLLFLIYSYHVTHFA